ncbi:polymorphic toxin-type HINT domain-containing protein [Streptomyces sp. V1I1]|uniref:polymorphic toxin-type HINT domain-containing protein n=1 Tax=Streptomyces sp. V1I1 TaxID=3042272 RepID=UPI00278190DF|nr:polymorphic toxin-type HINT domain-containing protein [Streptomyces sp. V1I1]MDQ0941112.1 RHS repeat-associated protein [Streptomyces sp. V1I1]
MSLRGRLLASRMPRHVVAATVLALAVSLSAATAEAIPVKPEGAKRPGVPGSSDPAKGKNAKTKPRPADPVRKASARTLDPALWPQAGSAVVKLSAPPADSRRAAPAMGAEADAGGLPITVAPAAVSGKSRASSAAAPPPSKVKVTSLGQKAATKWGSAALLTVKRADGAKGAAPVELSLDYSKFAQGMGGGYGSRLQLIELPACAATQLPGSKGCPATPKHIPFKNDPATRSMTAQVSAAPSAGAASVFAVAAGDSSSKGDYKATSLAPSASWSVANSAGGFSWDYPIRTVPTPGGLSPEVALGYSSQSADGRTAATNNQGSWIGEGFGWEPGFIERRYKSCSEDGQKTSAEQCWAFDNATIMLNGMSGELIQDDVTKEWHLASENGAKIAKLTGADNGDNNGEHWKLTTTDGTEYWFGLNKLPGWTTGKETTSSTWTAPVFGNNSGEPCYNATFTNAHCKQAWRWNLDHVKDTHGNVMSYFYGAETNRYALNGKTDVNGTEYHRGGYLKRIDYGQRENAVYTTKAPARVVFSTAERCLPDAGFDCAESKFTTANAARWPDTPVDRFCKANTKCTATQASQTFFTTKRLTGVTTQMNSGAAADAYADVDLWTFTHTFTDNGDDTKTLWLNKIDHEGKGGGGSIKMPSVELQGVHLKNRVAGDTDNIDAIHRFRLATVLSETGAQLDVTYAPTECTAAALPKPGESVKRCYPVVWAPPGSIDPKTDWFHKYVVKEITETDRTGGADDLVTRYDYQGNAGWRKAEPDGMTEDKFLTWGQWQGYGKVSVTSGNGQTMSTRIDYTYLQGLNGDKLPDGGTRTEEVTDSTGTKYTGHKEYNGFEVEAQTYDGAKVASKAISEPWKHDTATQTESWGTTKATIVKTRTTRGYTALSGGGWRSTKSVSTFDTSNRTGRLLQTDDSADLSTAADDTCTRMTYADHPAANLYTLPSRTEVVSVGCGAATDRKTQVIGDTRTYYDGGALGAAPTKGDETKAERLKSHDGTTATYEVTGTIGYDAFGRPTSETDAVGTSVSTQYTDANGLISKVKVTNALGHAITTDYAPAWGRSIGQTDANGRRSEIALDALGRVSSVWLADRARTQTPSIKYTYDVRRDKPVAIKTEKIENGGGYGVEYQLFDALLRPRQLQSEGPNGSRLVGDSFYDGTGKVKLGNQTYNAVGAPSNELLIVANGEVGTQFRYAYDGMGRKTADIFQVAGVEQWRTKFTYDGDRTHMDPPKGGVPTTVIRNVAGATTELRHYNGDSPDPDGPATGYDVTKYAYTPSGELASVTDAKSNLWRYEYDQQGRKTKSVDPDSGTTTFEYDAVDRATSSTDGRGKKVSTVYDKLGRPVTTWEGEPTTGTKLTEIKYDKAGWLGEAWAAMRYTSATEYFSTVTQDMDALYRPLKTAYSVPASQDKLAGTYVFTTTYNPDGTVNGQGMPAAGGLTGEAITFGYDDLQRPKSMTGKTSYVTDTVYSPTSQIQQLELSTGSGKKNWQTFHHEKGTDRLKRSVVDIEGVTGPAKSADYAYDQTGNVLSISDRAGASPDVQCFAYDNGQRLSDAWTPAATATTATGSGTVGSKLDASSPSACAAAPGASPLGGPAAYWKSYETDAIGNRTKEVRHDTGLNAAKDVTRTYTHGEGAAGPHAVTKVVEKTPTGESQSTYGYDASGNTDRRVLGGDTQRLDWNAEGKLAKATEADSKTTEYLYDVGGNRVQRQDAGGTTIYLPGMELRQAKGSSTIEATRYYGFAGKSLAMRTDNGDLSFLASDHHGTSELAVNATTGAVSQRRLDPFGVERTEPTGPWTSEKGFVGGDIDAQTGLTNIGARQYDPVLGKFISPDPLIDFTQPQQINGYAYANNSPVTLSDPSGLRVILIPGMVLGGLNKPDAAVNKAQDELDQAESNYSKSKQRMKDAALALTAIASEELGVDAALDCFSSGNLSACGETALNVATSFVGGLVGKLITKYAFRWGKAADLAKKIWGHLDDLVGAFKAAWDGSSKVKKAKEKLEKAKAAFKKQGGSCPISHSFLPATPVLLADGSSKPIEEIQLGDKIMATDPETGETAAREVVGTIVTEDDKQFVDLTIKGEAEQPAALISTTTHPFWVESEGAWIEAGDLQPGMELRKPDGETATVAGVRHFEKRQRTHDLTVSGIHSFYVLAADTPLLVHNQNANCPKRLSDQLPQGLSNAFVNAYEEIRSGGGTKHLNANTGQHQQFRGEDGHNAFWEDAWEYDVPGASNPGEARILIKTLRDGRKVMVDDRSLHDDPQVYRATLP